MLSISEFAKRIGVCSNTVRKWISSGKLIVGEHYLNVGRVYRFAWSSTCVEKLMRDLSPQPAPVRPPLQSRNVNRQHIRYRA